MSLLNFSVYPRREKICFLFKLKRILSERSDPQFCILHFAFCIYHRPRRGAFFLLAHKKNQKCADDYFCFEYLSL